MIWRQCISSQWSSNSFHVTHQEPFSCAFFPTPLPSTLTSSTFCLSSILLQPLQLQHEKAELEQHLEQEQEFQVNKLMKKIKKMENETISKQLTLEQVHSLLLDCWEMAKKKRERKYYLFHFLLQDRSFGYFCGLWPGLACLSPTIFIILMFCWQDISLVDPPATGCLTTWSFLRTFKENSTQTRVQMKFFAQCKLFGFLVWKCGIQPADQATSLVNLQERCDSVCPLKSSSWTLKRSEYGLV